MIKTLLCIAACAIPVASYAEAPKMANGMMVDSSGMTLYMFDKDTVPGKSACTGGCSSMWPAATADSYDQASGDWSFVPTAEGKNQWAYKGHPLYRFANDKQPGEMNGDGFKGMWHVVKP
jgi:predicted lipoprotein with Yx(FWY)xxD motif